MFAEQLYFTTTGLTDPLGAGGPVAYFAHIGGFLFGLAPIGLLARRRGPFRLRVH
jgi:membrane associated rhomboid family serine protease